ncbi:hypothetical protein QBC37DRAFT_422142 [Rhypophila decipiens]|uniref:Uncharacterized protein n=1 Tax=Rhypophila decipiens TaxID=261697 RepID=A0AAN7B7P8_9PEZI|nr:hypothetical protein QBC37DRAFT_422142 [Rhypophila decipiens]
MTTIFPASIWKQQDRQPKQQPNDQNKKRTVSHKEHPSQRTKPASKEPSSQKENQTHPKTKNKMEVDILTASKTAIKAYATSISLAADLSTTPGSVSEVALGMASHFLPNVTIFTLGSTTTFPDTKFAASQIENLLMQYTRSGLGTDIRLESSRVEVLSSQSSICWISWKIFPPPGSEGDHDESENCENRGNGGNEDKTPKKNPWTFTLVYGFRLVQPNRPTPTTGGSLDGVGGWEWVNADAEFEKLGENWPAFFQAAHAAA